MFEEPSVNLFSFNNPFGACRTCEGFGRVLGIDPDLVIPDKSLSVYEGAVAPWRSHSMKKWVEPLLRHGIKFDFPVHRPYVELTEAEQQLLWTGNQYFKGLDAVFQLSVIEDPQNPVPRDAVALPRSNHLPRLPRPPACARMPAT